MSPTAASARHILCMKWGTKYGPEYVNRLYAMVRRHLSGDFRFVCLTDDSTGIRSEVPVDAPLADWQRVWEREMRVNFLAAVDLTRAAILHFRRHGGGRIVNMASRAGQRGYASKAMSYGASKAALINLTKSVAQSHGHEGITAVALAPGWVRTEMAEAFIARHGEAAALAGIPIGAMAAPEEIGELVAFTFRPSQASLNGAVLDVNGGSYLR